MKRCTVAAVVLTVGAALAATPAQAVPSGTPDTTHDNVGALLLQPLPGLSYLVCSGALLDPTHFLTAAHCLMWADEAGFSATNFVVSFDEDLDAQPDGSVAPETFVPARAYAMNPAFTERRPGAHDVAVVTLAVPVLGVEPVQLPPAGFLDEEAARGRLSEHSFVNVGYGVSATRTGRPSFTLDGVRRVSTSPYQGLTPDFLRLNMQTAATGEGGSCYGDSGAPKFYELHGPRANLAVATTEGGDRACRAHGWNVRLDIAPVRDFLDDFVAVP